MFRLTVLCRTAGVTAVGPAAAFVFSAVRCRLRSWRVSSGWEGLIYDSGHDDVL